MNKMKNAGRSSVRAGQARVKKPAVVSLTLEDYRSLVDNAPDVIDRFDRGFRHLYVNSAGAKLLGIDAERIMGKTIRETGVQEPFCSLWEERIRKVFDTAQTLEVRDTFPSAKGLVYYESRCMPEVAPDGSVRTVLVISRDVTTRRQSEESMRESELLLHKIIEQSPISMAIVGMDGTIEYINWKAIETFGYSPEDIPTMDAWWVKAYPDEKCRKDVIARWMGHLGKALVENSEIAGDEYQVTCKDGTVKTMFIFGVPVASKVFAMFNDVTTMKQLQRDLEASRDELERKVKDRTVKLQALAEEIIRVENRERLRIAHVLHEDLQQWLAAAKFRLGELQELDATTSFRESAKRVHQMLDKAIAVTRSLAVDLRPPIIHEEGLKRALRWLADDMRKKFDLSVQIRVDRIIEKIGKEIGLFVFEAVRELLLNVVKHAGVKTVAIEVKAQGRGRFKVEVSDKGNGFDSSRDDDRKFGLFSIRERADVLGGELDIVSKPGRGTSIVLSLPLSRE